MPKPAIWAFQASSAKCERFQSLLFKRRMVPQWEMSSRAIGCSWLGIAESSPFGQPSKKARIRITSFLLLLSQGLIKDALHEH